MRREVEYVRSYFAQFRYEPELEEIHAFFPKKVARKNIALYLSRHTKNTPQGYIQTARQKRKRVERSIQKLRRLRRYFEGLSRFRCIRYVGLSGSTALLHASEADDVDLFIIAAKNRIWTARAVANLLALCFGIKRGRNMLKANDRVCLNLFFSENGLTIPTERRTEYMGHEVLQTVPIIDVNHTYRRFLKCNRWVTGFFPNVRVDSYLPYKTLTVPHRWTIERKKTSTPFDDLIEYIWRVLQIMYMKKPEGDERIEQHQLWFHPRDYQKQVRRRVFRI